MSRSTVLIAIALLAGIAGPSVADVCKWVDKQGVVHYAETCPRGVTSTKIQTADPPSQEEVEAAIARSRQMLAERQARKDLKKKEQELMEQEQQDLLERGNAMQESCIEARWSLQALTKTLPVYYDEDDQLHWARSLHDYWYEGERTYVDDQQRQSEIAHYQRVEAENCSEQEPDIHDRIVAYREKADREMCAFLKNRLESMRKQNTGIPSNEMREHEETIRTHCD